MGDEVQIGADWATDWDGPAQPAPDFDVDQRINWQPVEAAVLICCGASLGLANRAYRAN